MAPRFRTLVSSHFSGLRPNPLREDPVDDANWPFRDTRRIGQREVPPLKRIGQARMVDTEQVQHRGVKVVDVHRILDDIEAEVVGFAVCHSALNPTPGHPDRKGPRMVVAPVGLLGEPALTEDRAAELAAPYDQRIVQHAAVFQILDQRRLWLVDILGLGLDPSRKLGVHVPPTVEKFDETHIAFRQSPGEQSVGREGPRRLRVGPVALEGRLGLVRQVGQIRHGGLHAKGHLVLSDTRARLRVTELLVILLIELT